jgi:hypothetical protein
MFIYRLLACPRGRLRRRSIRVGLLGVWIVLIAGCVSGQGHVAEITVANPTDHTAMVEVAGDDGGGWLGLGRIQPGSDRTFGEVIDYGERWTFRFVHPEHREEITVGREELVGNDWRVEVPARYGERLAEFGVEPEEFAG